MTLDAHVTARLETYFKLLSVWDGKINLTGFNLADPSPVAVDKLLIEPLLAAKHVSPSARRMIDIGSGGGSPAIPLMLAVPRLKVLLVEAKTRKSVFLREALRTLGLSSGDVATARYEELLARPELHEAHDLLTIRAVRMETRVLMSLQAFVRPSGELFLFRSGTNPVTTLTPPLTRKAVYPLLDSLGSNVTVLEKMAIGARQG